MNGQADPLRGVVPVLETPFLADETVDAEGFAAMIDHVLGTGVRAVMFPGYASEVLKLDDAERVALQRILLERTRTRADVDAVVSIPDHATAVATKRAREAVEAGADVLNILPPHQLGPSAAQVVAHLDAILQDVDPTPVIVQYAPAQTGTALDAATLSALAARRPNLRWVKVESTPPGRLCQALLAADPPLPSLIGYAGLQLPDAMRRGAVGVQPGCSFTEVYVDILGRWEAGDRSSAEELHRRLAPYLAYWMQHVELIVAAEKAISHRRGLIATDVCRAPGWRLDAFESEMVDRFMDEFGEWLDGAVAGNESGNYTA